MKHIQTTVCWSDKDICCEVSLDVGPPIALEPICGWSLPWTVAKWKVHWKGGGCRHTVVHSLVTFRLPVCKVLTGSLREFASLPSIVLSQSTPSCPIPIISTPHPPTTHTTHSAGWGGQQERSPQLAAAWPAGERCWCWWWHSKAPAAQRGGQSWLDCVPPYESAPPTPYAGRASASCLPQIIIMSVIILAVSYTHLTLPTKLSV